MTCIAWDGKVLAGDRQSTWTGTPVRTRKVYRYLRHDGRDYILFGCAGDTCSSPAFARWVRNRAEKPHSLRDLNVMCIDYRGAVWLADETLNWARIRARQWAIGSGAPYALAAMASGKSAPESVRIASRFDVGTGFGVDFVSFKSGRR